jgi:lipopolysaccharide export system protein LptC
LTVTPAASPGSLDARAAVRRRAMAHSRLVHLLRWLLPTGIFAIVALLAGYVVVDTMRAAAVRPGEIPTQIRMVNPHFLGRDELGRSFNLSAHVAMRDDHDMRQVLLAAPVMVMYVKGQGARTLTADRGVYREDTRILRLSGHVRLGGSDNSAVSTDDALVDARAGTVKGVSPLSGSGQMGAIQAGSYDISGKGDRVILKGGVHARLNGGGSGAAGGMVP